MENKIKIDKTHVFNSIFRWVYMVLFIVSISLWISVGILNYRQKPGNIDMIESKLKNVEFDEEDDDYLFKLSGCEYTFKVSNSFEDVPNLCEKLPIGEEIKVFYYKNTIDLDQVIVTKIEVENNLIVNLEDTFKTELASITIGAIATTIVAIIVLVIDIIISKKKYYKKYDYFEFYSRLCAAQIICYEDLDFPKRTKKQRNAVIIFLILLLLLIAGIAVSGIVFPDYPHIIIPIVVILMILMSVNLFKSYGYRLYREKDVDLFIKKYFEYLEKDTEYVSEYCFEKDEFLYINNYYDYELEDEEDRDAIEYVKYTYEEMKFFA